MAYERPAQREVDRGTQERGKPNEVNNGPETRKPGAQDGVDKEIRPQVCLECHDSFDQKAFEASVHGGLDCIA